MAELLESIGHNVRRLREEKEWNQTELGFHADTSPSIISLIENGKRNPSTATLAKIAGALGVEVVELFPKAEASLWLDDALVERRLIDYRRCREALNHFCDYWEQTLAEDRLDRRTYEEFDRSAGLVSTLLAELWSVESVELRVRTGEDPQHVDKSEPWPPGLMKKSELWPAIDRWMTLALPIDKIAREQFSEDSTTVADVIQLFGQHRRAG